MVLFMLNFIRNKLRKWLIGDPQSLEDFLGAFSSNASKNSPQGDYFKNVALGLISGARSSAIGSQNPGLVANVQTSVNNIRRPGGTGGLYVFPTVDTQLFISSSDASDTNQCYLIQGLLKDLTEATVFVTTHPTDARIPVPFSGLLFRSEIFVNIDGKASAGDMYVSDDNVNITNGIPDTLGDIKNKMDAGNRQSSNGSRMCPAGKNMYLYELIPNTGKAADVRIDLFIRFNNEFAFTIAPPFQMNQAVGAFNRTKGFVITSGGEISHVAVSPTDGKTATVGHLIIFEDIT